MTSSEIEVFLAEMAPDIRAADRDLREIDLLEKKDVTAAGKLPDCETLRPRLDALLSAHQEDMQKANELELRIARLMDRYATNVWFPPRSHACVLWRSSLRATLQVDTLSELFVAWDDTLRTSETDLVRLERDYVENKRLGIV